MKDFTDKNLVNVVIPPLVQAFTYDVPKNLLPKISVGHLVEVPFGRRVAQGYIIEKIKQEKKTDFKIKSIRDSEEQHACFNSEQLIFFKWIAEYYSEPLSNVIDVAIPSPAIKKYNRWISLQTRTIENLKGSKQKAIVELLKKHEQAIEYSEILKTIKGSATVIKKLAEKNIIKIIEEELIGPSLGEASIKSGLLSLVVSIVLIFAFMMFFYSAAGLIASLMMILNLFLIIGLMAGLPFGFTLTLPGIAGLVLTLGMAVDANVIIYERIKEELHHGKTALAAMQDGFKHSLAAIIDGNLTTLITGLILGMVGMGPVTGFAVTLCIGIFTTLFTALLLTKVYVDFRAEQGKTYKFFTKQTEFFLKGKNIDFIGLRTKFYAFSGIIIVLGFISIFVRGFDLGVDFEGGREYRVRFEQPVNVSDVRNDLNAVIGDGTIVKQIGSSTQVKITTKFMIHETSKEADDKAVESLYNGLKKYLPNVTLDNFKEVYLLSSTKVDPSVSVDFRNSSIMATVLSLIAIFLYILIRFRTMGYSIGAVVATLHDALIIIALFT
ncbi:MAG: SecD/SecF family protein translocase subunit, partial [Bdellovibrionales bacterium]|nr:SecD/SecF family protein translocase subunit [Bdellovibrionales bacterium]